MASSPKDKFEAAVKVIRGLPKNGSFQPSHELMLKFYSYFKQATEGPCTSPKPGFWDLVNRKKWEAWTDLGKMESEEAMLLYVDELKKVSIHVRETLYPPQIVETMPQTEAVTEFLQKLDYFYEMVEDSENHNTLTVLDKSVPANGNVATANGVSGSEEDADKGDYSLNVTQLLKQDMKRVTESTGIIRANGLNGNHDSDDHDSPEAETDRMEKYLVHNTSTLRKDGETEEEGDDEAEEDEEEEEGKTSHSHSASISDSETENEEFCDTSDEPIEIITRSMVQSLTSHLPPLSESASSSTPLSSSKTVHFGSATPSTDSFSPGGTGDLSDSLLVHPPEESGDRSELNLSLAGHSFLTESQEASRLDITTCRGEEEDRDRRKRGQGSKGGSAGGSGGHGGDGDPDSPQGGGAGGSGSGSRRGLFPGPGGGGGGNRGSGRGGDHAAGDLNEQIVVTLLRLQHDMSGVLNRLNSLEALVKEGRAEKERKNRVSKGWWPFPDLSVKSAMVIFVWPLVVHCVISYISRRKRKLNR
ncbi:acyl-CoA-binding domain-containing protein 5 isoform X2 [Aplysia californica]|uniref:Acyl-CoA-binding domain-containing protein 5 isoform X2 n=1 Tax=Aplysia californica TaxID=6500 RepID=A0ABM0ZZY6_APLCA|nr:acyl-CoA-binding domain-containing protein 5 isoform X2 [Aplysia californica]